MTPASPSPPSPVRWTALIAGGLFALLVYAIFFRDIPGPPNLDIRGTSMGTSYQVKVAGSPLLQEDVSALRKEIEASLRSVNQAMSTYVPESEISRFNAHAEPSPFEASMPFVRVAWYALELARLSEGAFDPTLGPVINLWGFGHADVDPEPPDPEAIREALSRTGAEDLVVVDGNHLGKRRPDIELNLSAVAKGFAVDQISDLLTGHGLTNSYVEIGGEIVVRGNNPDGIPWRIGIELPRPDALPGEHLVEIVRPGNRAIATSGDYRNFRLDESGRRRSHLIDPRTGTPIDHNLASVSVVATTCMAADGLATALMVMGADKGLRWIETQPHAEALFVVRNPDGRFGVVQSSGFDAYRTE